jgi:hypothetical protein
MLTVQPPRIQTSTNSVSVRFQVFTAVTMKTMKKRVKWVGGTEYIIGFEGSQAFPVCPSGNCKLLTGTIEV